MEKVSGYQEEMKLAIDKKDHAYGLLNKFNRMRMQKRECDLLIKDEGKEIHVHRNVMMVGSDYFDAMFTHDMEEKQSGVVEMKDVSFAIFNKCVEFIYTGEISLAIEECEELLFVASMLQLTSVCDKISPFLTSSLNPSSFFATKKIADKFSLADLKTVCDDFALTNLEEIVREKEFNSLEKEYISFLITTKKSTSPESEDSKMAIMLQWIKADIENRSQCLNSMATLLDFRKVSPSYIKYLANEEQLCYSSPELMRMFLLASSSISFAEQRSATISFGSSKKKSLVVFDHAAKSLKAYNPSSQNWKEMQKLHPDIFSASFYAAVYAHNAIYVFVGDGKAFTLKIHCNGSTWENIPDMKMKHIVPCADVHEDTIYVVGTHSLERYRASERKWEEINCSGIANCNHCALVVHSDFIYTIGGYKDGELNDVNRFSPSSSSWSAMAKIPEALQLPGAIGHQNKIYVAGGYSNCKSVNDFFMFDPRANTWTQLSPMRNSQHYFGLCIVADQLYATGGHETPTIEKYDFEETSWEVVDKGDGLKIMAPATLAIEICES